jgi:hypothetical protein
MATDDPVEAAEFISRVARERFGLQKAARPKRKWWLFEG